LLFIFIAALIVTSPYLVTRVESGASTNTLYAHAETTTIGGSSYYLHKLSSADGPATTLNASAASTGRKLMGRWVYSLSGIVSIPASTWSVTYRAMRSASATSVVAHGDIDILIRKSDNTIRTTIATNVANSPSITLTNAWQTLTGTYGWPGYTVVDPTDYLEVAYYIEVTTWQNSKQVRLRVDDNTLPLSDQTKIENVMFTYPATIWTDKADYEYYENVTIFGSGFEALANVTVTIEKPDGLSDTVYAATDDIGNFTCMYLLNGIPGTYTVTATDGTNTATTTFTEGAITPKLYGYTLEPSPGWTHGDVKGYYECEWVPYKIEITNTKKNSYQLTVIVHHDYYDGTWYGLNQTRNFQMWRNGAPVIPTISGPVEDGWESGIQQLQFNWTFTINENDNCTLMFEPHIAIGAYNYPGSKVHTHIHDITSVPCTPISAGHRDVPIVVKGPSLCSVTFYTEPSTVGSISFQSGTYTNGQCVNFTYGTSGPATANAPVGWEFDHWEVTGNVNVSSTTANPTTATITCGGTLKAVFTQIQCTVTFYTDPSTIGSISFEGDTYFDGDSDTFIYGTSSPATANVPEGWVFDRWEVTGNVAVSDPSTNPTTVTITCGGTLKVVFKQITCDVTFLTDPDTIGNITFMGVTYINGQSDTFVYGTSGLATANAPVGWVFDHWETVGNVQVSSTTANPTTVTVTCGGTLKAFFKRVICTVTFYTEPLTIGNISFEGQTYTNGQVDTFPYDTSGPATANAPLGWTFDHWETTGNVQVSNTTTNPTTVTITCGGALKAVFQQIICSVTFYTDPSTAGSITFEGQTYTNGESDTFAYGTSGLVTANAPTGWEFDHWITMGNVHVSNTTANPTTFTITCGSNLTAIFKQIQCLVEFYTDPSYIGNITFMGVTYTHGQSNTFPYGTSDLATANAPTGWVFDHWETTGNVQVSNETANPTTVTVTCGGTLKAFFKRIICTVTFYTDPSTVGNISFGGKTYANGQVDTFTYDTSGLATANVPTGWEFDHWEATGNVKVSSTSANPTTVTITCGGTLKAFFKRVTCTVTFNTEPSTVGSISFQGGTYANGQSGTFAYGTSGPATANAPLGWVFDHWETVGNVQVSSTTTNPTTVTITCGGTLKAFFRQVSCTVTFYTEPSTVGSISFGGKTYTNGQVDTFPYGTSGPATANAPAGWEFDRWEASGNVRVSSTTANPTTVTITCGGTLKAFFREAPSVPPECVGGEMILFKVDKPSMQGQVEVLGLFLAAAAASIVFIRRKKRRQ